MSFSRYLNNKNNFLLLQFNKKTKRAVFMKSTFLILDFINMLFLYYIKSNKF
nr:MAG TPA: hypothetical protein [Bacteriophage sp.]